MRPHVLDGGAPSVVQSGALDCPVGRPRLSSRAPSVVQSDAQLGVCGALTPRDPEPQTSAGHPGRRRRMNCGLTAIGGYRVIVYRIFPVIDRRLGGSTAGPCPEGGGGREKGRMKAGLIWSCFVRFILLGWAHLGKQVTLLICFGNDTRRSHLAARFSGHRAS